MPNSLRRRSAQGYVLGHTRDYDRHHAVDIAKLLDFLRATQPRLVEELGKDERLVITGRSGAATLEERDPVLRLLTLHITTEDHLAAPVAIMLAQTSRSLSPLCLHPSARIPSVSRPPVPPRCTAVPPRCPALAW